MTMKLTTFSIGLGCGAAAAVAFVLACGERVTGTIDAGAAADARAAVDAASPRDAGGCSCPEAEPPLTGRIKPVVATKRLTPERPFPSLEVDCPPHSVLLGGGCEYVPDASGLVVLVNSGPDRINTSPPFWSCDYYIMDRTVATEGDIYATAYCLVPPTP